VLLFPIFMLAIYIGIAMLKHVIFHGVPTMNKPTEQQRESLREADSRLGLPPATAPATAPTEQTPDMAEGRLTPQEASEAIQESLEGTGITPQLLQPTDSAPNSAPPVRPYSPTAVVPSTSQWEKREVNGRMVDVRVSPYADPSAGEPHSEELPGWVRN